MFVRALRVQGHIVDTLTKIFLDFNAYFKSKWLFSSLSNESIYLSVIFKLTFLYKIYMYIVRITFFKRTCSDDN